jgi:hypothetical protein
MTIEQWVKDVTLDGITALDEQSLLVIGENLHVDEIQDAALVCHTDSGDTVYVVKSQGAFATGKTQRHAEIRLRQKLIETVSEDERIKNFLATYSANDRRTAEDWLSTYQELTGACFMGGLRFLKRLGIERYEEFTTSEFLAKVVGMYQNDTIISKIKAYYEEEEQ